MYNWLCIMGKIPARDGSKGLPRKKIRQISAKALIAWTIDRALSSNYFDRVIVSTDHDEIAKVSSKYVAEIPFQRPQEASIDTEMDFKFAEIFLQRGEY